MIDYTWIRGDSCDVGDARPTRGIVSFCCDACRKRISTLSLHEEVHRLATLVAISKFLQNFPVTFAVYNIHLRYSSERIFFSI